MTELQPARSTLRFRKSSYSGSANGGCVEVADHAAGVAVRDSKNPTGPVLDFSATGWRAFAATAPTTR